MSSKIEVTKENVEAMILGLKAELRGQMRNEPDLIVLSVPAWQALEAAMAPRLRKDVEYRREELNGSRIFSFQGIRVIVDYEATEPVVIGFATAP